MKREIRVERFDIASGMTESTVFAEEHAALWFAVELSRYQIQGNWICVYTWNGYANLPGALPAIRWSVSSMRKVEQGVISICNIHS
jgi:hypothetical protein